MKRLLLRGAGKTNFEQHHHCAYLYSNDINDLISFIPKEHYYFYRYFKHNCCGFKMAEPIKNNIGYHGPI